MSRVIRWCELIHSMWYSTPGQVTIIIICMYNNNSSWWICFLAAKLHHHGVRNQTLSWIKSFLADRSQQVVLNRKSSSPALITSGFPHGTVLCPLLFLVYIKGLPSRTISSVGLFADDCLLYRVIKGLQDTRAATDRPKPTSKMGKGLANDA